MINKIKKWISNKKLLHGISGIDVIPTVIAPIAQVDVRKAAIEKRVNAAFDKQARRMHRMSLVSHEANCDVFNCKKTYCFKNEPDRVVPDSESVFVRQSNKIEDLDSYK